MHCYNTKLLLIVVVLVFLSLIIISCDNNEFTPVSFEHHAWKSGDHELRGKMAHDLLEKKILIGKTREEVIDMLGSPDEETSHFVAYFMNFGDYFGPPHLVHIEFDNRSKLVKEAWITD